MSLEKGIRRYKDSYQVSIDLPPREGYKENSYSFHIGTIKDLSKAREIRRKAEIIKKECKDIDDTLYLLNELKQSVKSRKITNKRAAAIIEHMLYKHKCNACFIDFSSSNYDEIEKQKDWSETKEALELAIERLRS